MSEAESVKVPVPRVLLAMVLKVIDWLALLIVIVKEDPFVAVAVEVSVTLTNMFANVPV